MKYIIVDDDHLEVGIIFPNCISHDNVRTRGLVVSAGFCSIGEDDVVAYGHSVSLRLESRPQDSEVLTRCFKSMGA